MIFLTLRPTGFTTILAYRSNKTYLVNNARLSNLQLARPLPEAFLA